MYSRFQALFLAAPLEVEARSQETGASGQVADWLAPPYDESPVNCLEPIVEFQGGLRRVLGDGIEQPIEERRALVLSRGLERLPPGAFAGRRASEDLLEIPDDRCLVAQIAARLPGLAPAEGAREPASACRGRRGDRGRVLAIANGMNPSKSSKLPPSISKTPSAMALARAVDCSNSRNCRASSVEEQEPNAQGKRCGF